MNKEEKIKEILNSLPVDKDLIDCITIEMIDLKRPFESILNMIYNRRTPYKMFSDSKEVMDYLSANDTDLSNSLNIANTVGLSLLDINSRVLAILLFESKRMNEFYSLKDKSYLLKWLCAENPDIAYKKIREFLDKNDLGFPRERELDKIELLAEDYQYTNTGCILYL